MHTGIGIGRRLRSCWPAALVVGAFATAALVGLLGGTRPGSGTVVDRGALAAPQPPAPIPQVDASPARLMDHGRDPLARPAGRPAEPPTPPDEHRHTIPAARTSSDWVSGIVAGEQVVLADAALPWSWWLDPAVADMAGPAVVRDAVTAWNGVPGSRWAAAFAGEHAADRPRADGRSTIFAERSCADLTTANTYLFTDGGLGVDRYGRTATQILEADIGICPGTDDPFRIGLAVRHEVGHVIGLGHLCDPDEGCWQQGMGAGPHGCSVMYWQARSCQTTLSDGERHALVELYPTLRRLDGPDRDQVTARASFAVARDGAAPVVVVVAEEAIGPVAAAGAALAGRAGGPVMVTRPAPDGCLTGAVRAEASRALTRRGVLVLVGEWPPSCADLGFDWDVRVRSVAADPLAGTERLAHLATELLGPAPPGAVVVAADVLPVEAAVAASLAVRLNLPLLVAGSRLVASAGDVLEVADLLGGGPVAGALILAAVGVVPSGGVVLAPADDPGAALAAVAVAAGRDGVLLLTPAAVDGTVLGWLAARQPASGWLVADPTAVPPATAATYGAVIGS